MKPGDRVHVRVAGRLVEAVVDYMADCLVHVTYTDPDDATATRCHRTDEIERLEP